MIKMDIDYNELKEHANSLLKKDIYTKRKMDVCPHCKSNMYIKYGKFNGIQRFRCKECKKTFSLVTNSVWSYSKKKPSEWFKFCELILEKKVLRECAKILNININTAFAWRHKVLEALRKIQNETILKGNIHMTKTSVKENFKGNKKIETDRREKIIVVSANGDMDTMLSIPLCRRVWNFKEFELKVVPRISEGSNIIPYVDRYIYLAAKKYGADPDKDIPADNELMKNFRLIYKNWFKKFNGVATKYLVHYLSWFVMFCREKIFNDIEFLYELI
ncbi:Transposase [Clostridium sp. DSM 8431]|uniref:IS1/IS1595 family N-terminal zinc-binding domain-containing protein n=1 Tax=Clostridium sp. DSM 8431 TaxID=1761781 RepID=UPI0008E7CEFD|nr:transposase [Clostridium sp. DSM 8431]SFU37902.1 Transposase [Clostridium sp. DSM 8431]